MDEKRRQPVNMEMVKITENNICDAGKIHSESWKESHKSFCAEALLPATQKKHRLNIFGLK